MNRFLKTDKISRKQNIKIKFFYFLLLASCLFYQTIYSQETPRKKIGLVLSGGGAKGLAHIGVLKEIEKAGIKIDYIGGTSMGAIIGGLYACGYNATQLDSIFKDTNFDELVQDFVPRKNKTFYEKSNDEVYAITLPFKNFKVSIPKSLSKGLYNYNLMSKLTHNFRHITNFDELKIPFVCIATNLETGQEKVFRKGSLPLILSASSAFPSLFSPIEIDGNLYIDGGVANNYPIEELKKMGAEIIIGVDVQDDLKDRNQLTSVLGILTQISNFQMIENMKQKKAVTDIYIKPDVAGFSVISFNEGPNIVKKGEDAAKLVNKELLALKNTENMPVETIIKTDSLYIKDIGINGSQNYTQSYIIGKLRFKKGAKISYDDLNSGINNLNATQNFSAINYKLVKNNESDILMLEVKENVVKTFFKLGAHYDNLFKTSALLNVTKKNLITKNDVVSVDFMLGDKPRYNFDYYIDNGFYWSFGLKSKLNQFRRASKTDFSNNKFINSNNLDKIDIEYLDLSNQAYLQTIFAQKFLVGGGFEHKYINVSTNSISNTDFFIDKSSYLSLFGFLKYDSFSNKYFPKKGWYFTADAQSFLSSTADNFQRFTTAKADAGIVRTVFKRISLKLQAEAGVTVGTKQNSVFDYVLGGYGFAKINNFKSFFGYDFLSLAGNSYLKTSFTFDYEFFKKNHINLTGNIANIGNNIFQSNPKVFTPKYSGYALGYGLETLIGPVEIKQSWSPETGKGYTWFSIGFWF